MFTSIIVGSEGGGQSADVTATDGGGEVWDTVKFCFEIEEVSAFLFSNETDKVSAVHILLKIVLSCLGLPTE